MKRRYGTQTGTQGECHVNTEVMLSPAKKLPEATGEPGQILPSCFRGSTGLLTPGYRSWPAEQWENKVLLFEATCFVVFGHSGPNNLYSIHQPILLVLYPYEITWNYFSSNTRIIPRFISCEAVFGEIVLVSP